MAKKIVLNTRTLKENLDAAIRWVQPRTINQALQSFLIAHDGQKTLRISATDGLSTDITLYIEAGECDKFELCIPAARLSEKISAYSTFTDEVTVNFGKKVTIRSASGRDITEISTFDSHDFPSIIQHEMADSPTQIDADEFVRAVALTRGAVDPRSPFPALSGIYFSENGDVVSIDGYRMSMLRWKPIAQSGVLVNGNTCFHIGNAIAGKDDIVSFLDNERLVFKWPGGEISTTLMSDIKFPDYKSIIPSSAGTVAVVAGKKFKSKLLLAKGDAIETQNLIVLEIHEDALLIRSRSGIGGHQSELDYVSLSGNPVTVGLSIKYLNDAMSKIGDEDMSIAIRDEKSLVVFSPIDNDYIYGIMPMATV